MTVIRAIGTMAMAGLERREAARVLQVERVEEEKAPE